MTITRSHYRWYWIEYSIQYTLVYMIPCSKQYTRWMQFDHLAWNLIAFALAIVFICECKLPAVWEVCALAKAQFASDAPYRNLLDAACATRCRKI
eukprot:16015-Heterococcus_DN1.PRE.2